MFDTLSQSLQNVFKKLRGYGRLSEQNVQDALREVRLALLEADVNFQVVRDFLARVKEKSLGEEVLNSVTPGQQIVKRVHEELVLLLGGEAKGFQLNARPAGILLVGLNGAGKTTTAGKLARRWKKDHRSLLLAACDIRRPAAVDQLRILAAKEGVDFIPPEPGDSVPAAGRRAREKAIQGRYDMVIYDSGGRQQVEAGLMAELCELRDAVQAENRVLVLDAAIGQESVQVATAFHHDLSLTGLILTKLDGDARGGGALSVQAMTHVPVLLVGVGEKPDDLEPFYPDRMAARILGMGDVISLVEKAQEAVDLETMAGMEQKLRHDTLDLEDFLAQIQQVKKLGPLEKLMEMLPGQERLTATDRSRLGTAGASDMKKMEAILLSMTPHERRRPALLNARRRQRIAAGSGTTVHDINVLMRQFDQMRKMARTLKKAQKRLPRFGL